jgi:ABC-type glycerol-3-phosphate transport system substrate-binding protein
VFRKLAKSRLRAASAALVAAGLIGVGLAGCSPASSPDSAGSATSGHVTWWGWTPQPTAAAQYIAAFNKVYPKIKVTYKELPIASWQATLAPALASGNGPDIYDVQPGGWLTQFGPDAVDPTAQIKKMLGSDWKSKIYPINYQGLTMTNGKLAATALGSTFAGPIWINENLFKKYNLTPPTTMDQWVSDCAVFKSNGVGCFAEGEQDAGFNKDILQAIAGSVKPGVWTAASTGKTKWTDPAIVKTLSIWKTMNSNGVIQTGALGQSQYPDINNAFMAQKYAMVMMGTWYMQYSTPIEMKPAISAAGVADTTPFPILSEPFPDVAGSGHTGTSLFGDPDYGLAVNAKSKVKSAALTFAVWIGTSKAGQQVVANALNDLPALKGVEPDFNKISLVDPSIQKPALQKLIADSFAATQPRQRYISNDMTTAISAAATSVSAGQATPEQAAATLQAAAVQSGVKFK